LKGVDKWEQDFAGIALVHERADGSRYIADGHQRRALAVKAKAAGQADVQMNVRVLKESDGWTNEAVRSYAALKNIAEGTGTPLDAAKLFRVLRDRDMPPLPPTSALVRQGRALAELADEPFLMVVNGVVPENYGAIVGRILKDPKLQEAAIRVLNKTKPENTTQAEVIVRQVADTDMTVSTQADMFGDQSIAESLFIERAQVMDAAIRTLKKDKQVFGTLVEQADRIEGAGNRLSREANMERLNADGKVSDYIQKLAARKGPISEALTEAARSLRDGARPGDATRSFLGSVRRYVDEGDGGLGGGRGVGSVADSGRNLEPAEITASQELFEQVAKEENLTDLVSDIRGIMEDPDFPKEMRVALINGDTKTAKEIMEELEADERLVAELTDCVEGPAEVVA
jgi:hypothetical protein